MSKFNGNSNGTGRFALLALILSVASPTHARADSEAARRQIFAGAVALLRRIGFAGEGFDVLSSSEMPGERRVYAVRIGEAGGSCTCPWATRRRRRRPER